MVFKYIWIYIFFICQFSWLLLICPLPSFLFFLPPNVLMLETLHRSSYVPWLTTTLEKFETRSESSAAKIKPSWFCLMTHRCKTVSATFPPSSLTVPVWWPVVCSSCRADSWRPECRRSPPGSAPPLPSFCPGTRPESAPRPHRRYHTLCPSGRVVWQSVVAWDSILQALLNLNFSLKILCFCTNLVPSETYWQPHVSFKLIGCFTCCLDEWSCDFTLLA